MCAAPGRLLLRPHPSEAMVAGGKVRIAIIWCRRGGGDGRTPSPSMTAAPPDLGHRPTHSRRSLPRRAVEHWGAGCGRTAGAFLLAAPEPSAGRPLFGAANCAVVLQRLLAQGRCWAAAATALATPAPLAHRPQLRPVRKSCVAVVGERQSAGSRATVAGVLAAPTPLLHRPSALPGVSPGRAVIRQRHGGSAGNSLVHAAPYLLCPGPLCGCRQVAAVSAVVPR
mmetsp:Transcript_26582/g.76597  ORF Transcript_26582/g.76597 Transcript_26582/m.76597 type:complete len:225 (-) Transcript_26582:3620-4294(-)